MAKLSYRSSGNWISSPICGEGAWSRRAARGIGYASVYRQNDKEASIYQAKTFSGRVFADGSEVTKLGH
jgi:hypothetical protein